MTIINMQVLVEITVAVMTTRRHILSQEYQYLGKVTGM